MSPIKRFKTRFYKSDYRTSIAQLERDFGIFPPIPLTCKDVITDIHITHVVRTLRFLTQMRQILQLFQIGQSDLLKLRSSANIESLITIDMMLALKSAYREFRKEFIALSVVKRVLFAIPIIMVMPFLSIFAIFKYMRIVLKNSSNDDHAWYLPLSGEIVVLRDRKFSQEYVDAIISHEHLHRLQDANGHVARGSSFSILNSELLLKDYGSLQRIVLYLLLQNEVEARLHEIVLSYYRQFGQIPTTYNGFISLIESCHEIGKVVGDLNMIFDDSHLVGERLEYYARCPELAKDLLACILAFSDEHKSFLFVREALPVMYSNLLHYYGDINASKRFMDQIPETKFFFELYGVPSTMSADGLSRQTCSLAGC